MESQTGVRVRPPLDRSPAIPAMGRSSMLLLLTLAAGSVDAISYLGLGHVFTAMMTGNTVLLGLALGQGHVLAALRSILALTGFAVGVTIGALIVLRDQDKVDWPPAVTKALGVEGSLLALFAITWNLTGPEPGEAVVYVSIVMTAVAMGIQSAAVQRLGIPGVMTTYITGTLTSLMVDLARSLRSAGSETVGTGGTGRPDTSGRTMVPWESRVGLLAAVFLVYGLGALAGSFLQYHSLSFVTVLPSVAVAVVLANAALHHRHQA
jgi:uncharacterized membrane protein YoaK (UPF0700 family)